MFEVFAFAFASKTPLKFHLALANLREKALRPGEFVRGQMPLGDIVAPETKGAKGTGMKCLNLGDNPRQLERGSLPQEHNKQPHSSLSLLSWPAARLSLFA